MLKGIDSARGRAARGAARRRRPRRLEPRRRARWKRCARRSIACLKSSTAVEDACPCSSTAAFVTAPTSTRRSRLGARGVGIGRPYIWGLSAFGQEGVERVLEILRAELTMTMKQMGTPTVKDITAARVARV